jgi:hypothetical protein
MSICPTHCFNSKIMASVTASIPELFIGYAMAYCSNEQVTEVFNSILEEDIVESVVSTDGTNFKSGKPFKRFFIKFKKTSTKLEETLERIRGPKGTIEAEQFINVAYDRQWFWKVIINEKKGKPNDASKPRIMEKGEVM